MKGASVSRRGACDVSALCYDIATLVPGLTHQSRCYLDQRAAYFNDNRITDNIKGSMLSETSSVSSETWQVCDVLRDNTPNTLKLAIAVTPSADI